jgi:hypothetical protein
MYKLPPLSTQIDPKGGFATKVQNDSVTASILYGVYFTVASALSDAIFIVQLFEMIFGLYTFIIVDEISKTVACTLLKYTPLYTKVESYTMVSLGTFKESV